MATLTWHGHSCFTLETDDGTRILFDPFLDDNPVADVKADEVDRLDYILVSHGHFDHFARLHPDREAHRRHRDLHLRAGGLLPGEGGGEGARDEHRRGAPLPLREGEAHARAAHGQRGGRRRAGTHTTDCCGFLLTLERRQAPLPRRRHRADHGHAAPAGLTWTWRCCRSATTSPWARRTPRGPWSSSSRTSVIPMHYDTWELIAQDPEDFRRRRGRPRARWRCSSREARVRASRAERRAAAGGEP